MTYLASSPPRLSVDAAFVGAGRFWEYISLDPPGSVLVPYYISNAQSLGMLVGDLVLINDIITPETTWVSVTAVTSTGAILAPTTPISMPFREITSGSTVVMLGTDYEVAINKTVGSATLVTLPAGMVRGQCVRVTDLKGDAGTNFISIRAANSGTINGATGSLIRALDWETTLFRSLGADNWSIVA